MAFNEDDAENVPYRSPVNLTPRNTVSPEDERDFSTLKLLLKMARETDAKARDNNTLDLSHPKVSVESQIYGIQWAMDTLITPFLTTVEDAVRNINAQNTGEES